MPEQVLWTTLPAGLVDDDGRRRLRLSVLVSPRLTTTDGRDGVLAQFEDFRRWPATIADASFDVELDGTVVLRELRPTNTLEVAVWTALFSDDTLVRSYGFKDLSGRPLVSYPVRPLLVSLAQLYGSMALDASAALPPIRTGGKKEVKLVEALEDSEFRPDPRDTAGRKPLTRFRRFHTRPARPDLVLPTPEQLRDLLDFHQAISCMGDYPGLMRPLGLVLDLELPADSLPTSEVPVLLRVLPRWEPADASSPEPNRSPTTRARWDGRTFVAASTSEDLRGGHLVLSPGVFDLVDVDLDGAAHKLVNLVLSLADQHTARAPDTPTRAGLPALRSAGMAVVQLGRAAGLASRLAQAKAANAAVEDGRPADVVLGAEQLVRGFCIDVWDSRSQSWRSVCRRIGRYQFTRVGTERTIEDDGFVQLSAAGVPKGPPVPSDDSLYLHEALLRWDGWSLVATRPGLSLNSSEDPDASPERPKNEPLTQFKLQASFRPPAGSLPALRFGRQYRVRARVVDLAGNAVPLDRAGDEHALPASPPGQPYRRFEPVPPPAVVLRRPLTVDDAGESVERLVVRTLNRDPGLDEAVTAKPNDRHIAPPRTTANLAETHGMFDDSAGRLRGDDATHAMIAERDAAQFRVTDDQPVEPGERLVVPYLPDPLARGAALRNLPGAPKRTLGRPNASGELEYRQPPVIARPGSATLLDFGPPEGWPRRLAFRILLTEGSEEPVWDEQARVLTVGLPKASTTTVALSSYLDRADLDLMGVWDWMRQEVEKRAKANDPRDIRVLATLLAEATQRAVEGGHWMLSPARDLVLVHAVQQPLGQPTIDSLVARRDFDATAADFLGSMRVHGRSTAKVDILASWGEFTDTGPEPMKPSPATGHLAELSLRRLRSPVGPVDIRFGRRFVGTYHPRDDRITLSERAHPSHVFPDTRHRALRCRLSSTSRFAEYFRRRREVALSGETAVVLDTEGVAQGSEIVRSLDRATVYQRAGEGGGDYVVDYAAGTIARTPTSAIASGDTVDVEFLPPVSRQSHNELVVHVPSSVRPAAPDVLYVVPVFEWTRQTRTNLLASDRRGGWLRVYLGRSWYSSGEDEMLGVVRRHPAGSDDVLPYVSQWGRDPIRVTADPHIDFGAAAVHDAGPSPEGQSIGLTLAELPPSLDHRVVVAAYRAEFDPERDLWYSDIRIDAGQSFQPFVRLALARYQPHSVERFDASDPESARDVKLSRVVVADFAQLSSDRSVLVTYDPAEPQTIKVVVAGSTYEDAAGGGGPSFVTVHMEERRPGAVDELGWVPAEDVTGVSEDLGEVDRGVLLWRGQLTLPPDRSVEDYRLVVRELDTLDPGPGTRRVLYADALELEALAPERATSTLALTSVPNPSRVGQSVTFTATISSEGSEAPTGDVIFRDGVTTLGSRPISKGTASLSTSELAPGTHEIVASYAGSGTVKAARDSVVHRVGKAGSTVDVVPRLEIHGATPF